MLSMAIVLPKRRKQADIFAPSKAIQDAKAKIGPAYFDVSLLECSRNAVELTRLVYQWEQLDKEKLKVIKDITHDQETLLRTMKKYKTNGSNITESVSTPGFRFKSNGDIKTPSKSMMSVEHVDDQLKEEAMSDSIESSSPSNDKGLKSEIDRQKHDYESVDYENEIRDLENVIRDIYRNLVKNKVSVSNTSLVGGKLTTFLRAHTNEYTHMTDPFKSEVNQFAHPNDRFAFKPGSSGKRDNYLHKHEIKTPSHRSCIGCQIRLKQEHVDFSKMKKSHSENLTQRRWNYVPQGKYVQSTTALHTAASLTERKSSHLLVNKSSKTKTKSGKSMVHFTEEQDVGVRGAISLACPKFTSKRPKSSTILVNGLQEDSKERTRSAMRPHSSLSVNTNGLDFNSEQSINKSLNVLGWKSGVDLEMDKLSLDRSIESSLSHRSACASSARLNAHFVDHESRLNLLKSFQAEEDKNCEKKIHAFLNKIDLTK